MYRVVSLALLSAAVLGCGETQQNPNSLTGSFTLVESSVNELCTLILSPGYKPGSGPGAESDQIGLGLSAFEKEAQGTAFEADAKEIVQKMRTLDQLTSTRAPVAKQREAAKDLQATVAAVRAKM